LAVRLHVEALPIDENKDVGKSVPSTRILLQLLLGRR